VNNVYSVIWKCLTLKRSKFSIRPIRLNCLRSIVTVIPVAMLSVVKSCPIWPSQSGAPFVSSTTILRSDHRQSVTLDHSISGHRIKKQLTVCRGSVLNPFPRSTSSSVSAESSRLISTKSKSQIFYFFFFVSVATVPDRDQTGKHCHLSKTHTFLIICFKTQMSESTFMYDFATYLFSCLGHSKVAFSSTMLQVLLDYDQSYFSPFINTQTQIIK